MSIQSIKERMNNIQYEFSDGEKYIVRSGEQTLEKNIGNCLSGAFAAAILLEQEGHKPQLLDVLGPKYGHCVAIYSENNKFGSIGQSRYDSLKHKDPIFDSIDDLALAYVRSAKEKGYETTKFRIVDLEQMDNYINWRTDSENLDKKGVNQIITVFPTTTISSLDKTDANNTQ